MLVICVLLSLAALCVALLSGQEKPKTGIDKVALEAYVRHLLAVIPEVQVKIDDPKPSPVSTLEQVDVHFIYGPRTQDETFYVSKDGQEDRSRLYLRPGAESVQGRSRKVEDQPVAQLRRRRRARGAGGVQRFRVPQLQRRSQDLARETARCDFPKMCGCISRIFPWSRFIPGPSRRPWPGSAFSARIRQPSGNITIGFTNIRPRSLRTT